MTKIGINGFGRLGRLLLRVAVEKCRGKIPGANSPMVVMVNDANIPLEGGGVLVKKDTFQGGCGRQVVDMNNCIMIDGLRIEYSREEQPNQIPWDRCKVDYVIDTTWKYTTSAAAKKLLVGGVKRAIVTGCWDVPMLVLGVNHACFDLDMKVVSCTSPSTNCLAVMLMVLHESFGVKAAQATTLRPFGNYYRIMDDPKSGSIRDSRSGICCMAPTAATPTGKVLKHIIPDIGKKVETITVRVPVPCIGAVSLAVKLKKKVTMDMINYKFREASDSYMRGIIRSSEEELVSHDIIGDCHSCVYDCKAGKSLSKKRAQLFAWYDSEYAFARRLYDMAAYISSREKCGK